MARLNGKPKSSNPRVPMGTRGWSHKAQLWLNGWTTADAAINGITEWDRAQEIIDELGDDFAA